MFIWRKRYPYDFFTVSGVQHSLIMAQQLLIIILLLFRLSTLLNYVYNKYSHVTQAKYTVYSTNPWESNHRDGPMGHKNAPVNIFVNDLLSFCIYLPTQITCKYGKN